MGDGFGLVGVVLLVCGFGWFGLLSVVAVCLLFCGVFGCLGFVCGFLSLAA